MTTIIFKEGKKGNVKVAYDSCVTYGRRTEELEFDKVFVNAGHAFGVAGALRDSNILRFADLPEIPEGETDVDRFVVRELVPAMIKALKDSDASEVTNHKLETESHTLVAVRGRVYELGSDMSVCRNTEGLYAIGSGSPYARVAIACGKSLAEALEIASEFDSGTGNTLKLTTTAKLLGGKHGNSRN